VWRVCGREIPLGRPLIAGVLNVTPDSFSDGGRFLDPSVAVERAWQMVEEGAALIDVGAESTRPGAEEVSSELEWSRLGPVLAGLRDLPVPVSVDTTKHEVAERALDAGASVINDISGLAFDPRLADLAAKTGAGLVLMHMRGTPVMMQHDTTYGDVVTEVAHALERARATAIAAGCRPDQVAVDPGIGFGKSLEGNLQLLARLGEIASSGAPVWIGPSRKSFLGQLLDGREDRLAGTIAACLAAVDNGADVLRVHDVRAVSDALRTLWAVEAHDRESSAVEARRPERTRVDASARPLDVAS